MKARSIIRMDAIGQVVSPIWIGLSIVAMTWVSDWGWGGKAAMLAVAASDFAVAAGAVRLLKWRWNHNCAVEYQEAADLRQAAHKSWWAIIDRLPPHLRGAVLLQIAQMPVEDARKARGDA